MKINGRKIFGFIITEIILVSMFFIVLFNVSYLIEMLGETIIGAIIINFVILVGGNSMDKFVTSKWFVKELRKENKN